MTATITPPAGVVLRADPTVRMNDYLEALRFYLSLPSHIIDRIVFVDNSGSDTTPLHRLVTSIDHDKLVEIISFDGNDHPTRYGKAFGEFGILDFALTHTSFVSPTGIFWKVTGRLRCLNLADIISSVREPYDLLCDLHRVQTFGLGRPRLVPWMDLRLFSSNPQAYDLLFGGARGALTLRFNSQRLFTVVLDARECLRIVPRFPREPCFAGFSGQSNTDYDSPLRRVKRRIRATLRRIAPWLWL